MRALLRSGSSALGHGESCLHGLFHCFAVCPSTADHQGTATTKLMFRLADRVLGLKEREVGVDQQGEAAHPQDLPDEHARVHHHIQRPPPSSPARRSISSARTSGDTPLRSARSSMIRWIFSARR